MHPREGKPQNPYYIDTQTPHYLVVPADKTPLIFTTDMSFCVGIGLFEKHNGVVRRMAIYHSYSEHMDCDEETVRKTLDQPSGFRIMLGQNTNFIHAIRDFLLAAEKADDVTVIIHVNQYYGDYFVDQNVPERSYNYKSIKHLVNVVSAILGKGEVRNFIYAKGGSFLCLMNDGTYYYDRSNSETIARKIAMFMHDHIARRVSNEGFLYRPGIWMLDGSIKRGTMPDKLIINEIRKAHKGEVSWMDACRHVHDELEKLCANRDAWYLFGRSRGGRKDTPMESYEKFLFALDFLFRHLRVQTRPAYATGEASHAVSFTS